MHKRYMIEVYEPGSGDAVARSLESDQPFGAFSAGDLLSFRGGDGQPADFFVSIVRVEHRIGEAAGLAQHKICLFTAPATNDRETRLNPTGLGGAGLS